MIEYKTEVTVNRPVEQVFKFAADVARMDDWTDMKGTRLVSQGALGVGSQIETTIKFGPSKQVMSFQVAAFEQNRRIAYKTTSQGAVQWDAEYTFEPQGDSATRVVSVGQLRFKGALKLSEPLLAGEVRSGEAKELVRFKDLIESGK